MPLLTLEITEKYCCPLDTPLHDCEWRGNWPDCPNAKCEIDEVAVVNDPNGEPGWFACHCKSGNSPYSFPYAYVWTPEMLTKSRGKTAYRLLQSQQASA